MERERQHNDSLAKVAALFPPPLGLAIPIGGRHPGNGYSSEESTLPGGAHILRPERCLSMGRPPAGWP